MPTSLPTTLRDIAAALGVSRTTVSLALKNNPQISESRRQEVQQMAIQMGYSPNPAATALAHLKQDSHGIPIHSSVAWINAWPRPEQLREHYENDCYWLGAEEALGKAGYRLDEFIVDADLTLPRLHAILIARNIQGIFIPPQSDFVAEDWAAFSWNEFSVVRIGRTMTAVESHMVGPDLAANAILAFHQIQQHGYQRIGFVGMNHHNQASTAGALLVNSRVPLAQRVEPLLGETALMPEDQAKFQDWLRREKPDAIFSDQPALAAMLAKAGLRVPEDIGLVALCVTHGPTDAGIDPHGLATGQAAARLLLSLIRTHKYGLQQILKNVQIKGSWFDGSSLPPRQAADFS
jgi:LacI family transcriptional regulator